MCGKGPNIIFHDHRNTSRRNCPDGPKELSRKQIWVRGVVSTKYVPLQRGQCVLVWRLESYWNCRWINRTDEVRVHQKLHHRNILNEFRVFEIDPEVNFK